MNWYFMQGGERKGPVNLEGLRELLQDGEIDKSTMVWNKGMGDTWTKIADVPTLAGPQESADDPAVKEDFRRKMEERNAALAAQKRAALKRNLIVGVAAIVLIALGVAFVKGAPKREWGASSSNPVCSLKKLEDKLLGEYQMDKETLERCENLGRPSSKIYQFSGAKKTPGDHVSGKGTITVTVDDGYNVKALVGTFPSPGMRGPTLNNRSVVSLTMNSLWLAHGGKEEKALSVKNEILPQLKETGFAAIPDDAVCEIIEAGGMRGVWAEHGPNTRWSIVYFEAAD